MGGVLTGLDRLIPQPRLVEIDRLDLQAPADVVWERLRHTALGQSPLTRALFALRTLASRGEPGAQPPGSIRIDDLVSTPARPGFQIFVDDPPHEVAVGAIGQVWRPNIPFVHVADTQAFAAFAAADYVKVAWALRISPLATNGAPACSHVELEVRVAATSARAWRRFRLYFMAIGPASRFIRHSLLRRLAREFGEMRDVGNRGTQEAHHEVSSSPGPR